MLLASFGWPFVTFRFAWASRSSDLNTFFEHSTQTVRLSMAPLWLGVKYSTGQNYFKACRNVLPSTTLYYKACRNVLPSTTLYYKACGNVLPSTYFVLQSLQERTFQYYFVLQSLQKCTSLYYNSCRKWEHRFTKYCACHEKWQSEASWNQHEMASSNAIYDLLGKHARPKSKHSPHENQNHNVGIQRYDPFLATVSQKSGNHNVGTRFEIEYNILFLAASNVTISTFVPHLPRKTSITLESNVTISAFVPRLPRKLGPEAHQILRLPRKEQLGAYQVLRLPRKLGPEVHQLLRLPRKMELGVYQILRPPREVGPEVHQILRLPREMHLRAYQILRPPRKLGPIRGKLESKIDCKISNIWMKPGAFVTPTADFCTHAHTWPHSISALWRPSAAALKPAFQHASRAADLAQLRALAQPRHQVFRLHHCQLRFHHLLCQTCWLNCEAAISVSLKKAASKHVSTSLMLSWDCNINGAGLRAPKPVTLEASIWWTLAVRQLTHTHTTVPQLAHANSHLSFSCPASLSTICWTAAF